MLTSVMTFPSIQAPCFIPAGKKTETEGGQTNGVTESEQWDFDLLAEYLLDDGDIDVDFG